MEPSISCDERDGTWYSCEEYISGHSLKWHNIILVFGMENRPPHIMQTTEPETMILWKQMPSVPTSVARLGIFSERTTLDCINKREVVLHISCDEKKFNRRFCKGLNTTSKNVLGPEHTCDKNKIALPLEPRNTIPHTQLWAEQELMFLERSMPMHTFKMDTIRMYLRTKGRATHVLHCPEWEQARLKYPRAWDAAWESQCYLSF